MLHAGRASIQNGTHFHPPRCSRTQSLVAVPGRRCASRRRPLSSSPGAAPSAGTADHLPLRSLPRRESRDGYSWSGGGPAIRLAGRCGWPALSLLPLGISGEPGEPPAGGGVAKTFTSDLHNSTAVQYTKCLTKSPTVTLRQFSYPSFLEAFMGRIWGAHGTQMSHGHETLMTRP